MHRRRFISACLAASGLAACTDRPTPRLRFGTYLYSAFAPFFLARNRGLLEDPVIQMTEFTSVSEAVLAFQNQAIEVLTCPLDSLLHLVSTGHKVRVIAALSRSDGAHVLVGKAGISSMAGLRGKTVGYETVAMGGYFLAHALAAHGLRSDEIVLRSARPDRSGWEITRSIQDAAVAYDPYRATMVRSGGVVLFDSKAIPGGMLDLLVVRDRVLTTNRQTLRGLLAAWYRGTEILQAEKETVAQFCGRRERSDAKSFLESTTRFHLYSREESKALLAEPGGGLEPILTQAADFMVGQRLLPAVPVLTGVKDASIIDA